MLCIVCVSTALRDRSVLLCATRETDIAFNPIDRECLNDSCGISLGEGYVRKYWRHTALVTRYNSFLLLTLTVYLSCFTVVFKKQTIIDIGASPVFQSILPTILYNARFMRRPINSGYWRFALSGRLRASFNPVCLSYATCKRALAPTIIPHAGTIAFDQCPNLASSSEYPCSRKKERLECLTNNWYRTSPTAWERMKKQ